MTVLKRLVLSVTVLLLINDDVFASHDVLASGLRNRLSMKLRRVGGALHAGVVAIRPGTQGENSHLDIHRLNDSRGQNDRSRNPIIREQACDTLEKCELLLTESHRLFEEIKRLVTALQQREDRQTEESLVLPLQIERTSKNDLIATQQNPERTLAGIPPVNNDDIDTSPAHICDQEILLPAVPEAVEEPRLRSRPKAISENQESQEQEEEVQDQDLLTPAKARKSFTTPSESNGCPPEKPLPSNIQRLYRIYGLLPEYRPKSITDVLTGATLNTKLPVWNAVMDAIKKIQKEASAKGDKTQMDLDYFRRLYSSAVNASPDGFLKKSNVYSISPKEINRLNRIYELLPEYRPKSITDALSGATVNTKLPVWNAVLGAIKTIQKDALVNGDKTRVDLDYFRKLHWSSMRVMGKGGGRAKIKN